MLVFVGVELADGREIKLNTKKIVLVEDYPNGDGVIVKYASGYTFHVVGGEDFEYWLVDEFSTGSI